METPVKTQESKRAQGEFSIDIAAPADDIFLLACPVEELKWIDGWDFTMVYSESGKNEPGCIFIEEMTARHVLGPMFHEKTYWITLLHDPKSHAVHFILARSTTLTHLKIHMDRADAGKTKVSWNMTMTSIREDANDAFDEHVADRMTSMLMFLGHSLKHFCETGGKLAVRAE